MLELADIDNDNFIAEVIDSAMPVLIDCWAAWCGPCRKLAPELEALAGQSLGRFKVVKLDVEANPGIAELLGISILPTMVLFVDGVVVETLTGFRPKEAVLAHFEPHLPRKRTPA